jgi:hypothetical protein
VSEKNTEPGVFVFPLPAELEKCYFEWASSFRFNEKALVEMQEKGYTPLFIPVFPGGTAYSPDCPAGSGGNPCGGSAQRQSPVNPYLLFLILILLLLSFKKDQILAAVRRFLLKSAKKDPAEDRAPNIKQK